MTTCIENADYDPSMVPNQISFNKSNNGTEQCFDVMIIDDNDPEDTENFMLTFDTPLNSQAENPLVTLSPRIFDVAITDNDEGIIDNIIAIKLYQGLIDPKSL